MEALAAIGLATNIITFIDFSYKLISGSHQIFNSVSGLTLESSRLGTVVDDLKSITDRLVSDLPGDTKNERELCQLAENCRVVSEELSDILSPVRLTGKKSKWKAFRAKWKNMLKEKNIAAIEEKLNSYKAQILIRLNFML